MLRVINLQLMQGMHVVFKQVLHILRSQKTNKCGINECSRVSKILSLISVIKLECLFLKPQFYFILKCFGDAQSCFGHNGDLMVMPALFLALKLLAHSKFIHCKRQTTKLTFYQSDLCLPKSTQASTLSLLDETIP